MMRGVRLRAAAAIAVALVIASTIDPPHIRIRTPHRLFALEVALSGISLTILDRAPHAP